MFRTVVAAIDGTRASFEAGRQAARLTGADGLLVLVAATDPFLAITNHWGAGPLVAPGEVRDAQVFTLASERLHARAAESLERVRGQVPPELRVDTRIVAGRPWDVVRDVAAKQDAELVVTGSHAGRRLAGLALGSTALEVLHDAPCSAMVARPPFDPCRFPARVVVGLDGSPPSLHALRVARGILAGVAGGAEGHVVVAHGARLDDARLASVTDGFTVVRSPERAVDALVAAAAGADLLVLGARGLGGVAALGSVSQRVAHRAESSVMVVRAPGE